MKRFPALGEMCKLMVEAAATDKKLLQKYGYHDEDEETPTAARECPSVDDVYDTVTVWIRSADHISRSGTPTAPTAPKALRWDSRQSGNCA